MRKKYFLENDINYGYILLQKSTRILLKISLLVSIIIAGTTTKLHAKASYSSIVIDVQNNKTVYGFEQHKKRYPASLTKMMTLYIIFEHLQSKKIQLDTKVIVSQKAVMQSPSKLYLKENAYFTVEQGILALITRSANDVSVAFGEFISGSEKKFANLMSIKAKSLGMNKTVYKNSSGLHNNKQVTTAHDQAILGIQLRKQFPQYYKYFSLTQFRYRNKIILNHNKLINKKTGIDGIKTGYTQESGFNIVASLRSNDKSAIVVVMGMPTSQTRDQKTLDLISSFINKKRKRANKNFKNNSQSRHSHNKMLQLKHFILERKKAETHKKISSNLPKKHNNLIPQIRLMSIPKPTKDTTI
ncbi:MAG: D-alanyl-D-alanine carboxypeptidase [Candidatus Liberibacter europaeus]|uniref:D-alanyl-D-alanine carboxypeptidase n=1 Tax=Candidatus Liberibacter europaeus TaxID=744859 RepID=A0A2T4VXM4_9HYPH|nr:D-alanyl-D-alanine carboxypeptidase [Candidatus Liberibacter europaeus]PTL86520.1 MAG: D-alanyl-D-alanine carboxypeptidase [Candidatus Liberibacter europaeus]